MMKPARNLFPLYLILPFYFKVILTVKFAEERLKNCVVLTMEIQK